MKKTARIVVMTEEAHDDVVLTPKKTSADDFDLGLGSSFHLEDETDSLSGGSSSSGSSSDGDGIE